ncbi:MAG: quinolinate synthase NadA [Myxococcota bacterium]|nr:quinolinate synthase NadA [Myxococcota bacterium]
MLRPVEAIRRRRADLGDRVALLAHHYQRPEIVAASDHRGDSYGLARTAAGSSANHIVFCGVRFMAEAAAVLARPEQRVWHPNPESGCPMADMADVRDVERAWRILTGILGDRVVPMVYMNSNADVKAFCGRNGGAVLTSSNARRALEWAWRQRPVVLFLPDQHLGRNTALAMGVPRDEIALWRWRDAAAPVDLRKLERARIVLWEGHCHVHTHFRPEHVAAARASYPGARILVHPECDASVVELADGSGSTGYLVEEVERAAGGSTIAIGTEENLIGRLAAEHPGKRIVPLARSLCPNMFRITARHVIETLEHLDDGSRRPFAVPAEVAAGARTALERMLRI